jgi:hypothetical protein
MQEAKRFTFKLWRSNSHHNGADVNARAPWEELPNRGIKDVNAGAFRNDYDVVTSTTRAKDVRAPRDGYSY